jgi:hypothetical protein
MHKYQPAESRIDTTLTSDNGVMIDTSVFKLHDSRVRSMPTAAEMPTPTATARTSRLCWECRSAKRCGAWCSRMRDAAVLTTASAGSASVTATPRRNATASNPTEDSALGKFSPSLVPGVRHVSWARHRAFYVYFNFVPERNITLRCAHGAHQRGIPVSVEHQNSSPMGIRPYNNPKLKNARPNIARPTPQIIVFKP